MLGQIGLAFGCVNYLSTPTESGGARSGPAASRQRIHPEDSTSSRERLAAPRKASPEEKSPSPFETIQPKISPALASERTPTAESRTMTSYGYNAAAKLPFAFSHALPGGGGGGGVGGGPRGGERRSLRAVRMPGAGNAGNAGYGRAGRMVRSASSGAAGPHAPPRQLVAHRPLSPGPRHSLSHASRNSPHIARYDYYACKGSPKPRATLERLRRAGTRSRYEDAASCRARDRGRSRSFRIVVFPAYRSRKKCRASVALRVYPQD